MSFYDSIVSVYDSIFPLNQQQVTFTEQCLKGDATKHLLDVGCGTGSLCLALAQKPYQLTGIDLDAAMIAKAQEKNQHKNVRFQVLDMLKIGTHFQAHRFDVILCYGNTLVHLPDKKSVLDFFIQVRQLLKPGGTFLIQLINYDRILEQQLSGLPTIETDHLAFERKYTFYPDRQKILFRTLLSWKNSDRMLENSQWLLPLRKVDVEELLEKAQFKKPQFYGSFKCAPWTMDAIPCICETSTT